MKKLAITALTLAALSQTGAEGSCGGPPPVLRDPGFDLWCGDQLCAWKLVRGDVRRVGTWHDDDSGVAFLGNDSAIQQLSPANSGDGTCIEFSLVANVSAGADVFLDIDIQADGTIDRQERIPTSSWKPILFHIFIEPPYDGIRFELNKRGAADAVLAQIGAKHSSDCEGIERIVPIRPNGSSCTLGGAECTSNLCADSPFDAAAGSVFGTTCMGCNPSAPACEAGETCGVGDPLSPVLAIPVACVPVATRELAELCITDDECASGKCSPDVVGGLGACSACDTADDCGGGSCARAWIAPKFGGPNVCRPGEHAGVTGTPCGTNADCASDRCTGSEYKVCNDGRACVTDANCPIEDGFDPGPCTTVGIQGGTCD
jgi:hypothetical protein